jgi:hypothetical protein
VYVITFVTLGLLGELGEVDVVVAGESFGHGWLSRNESWRESGVDGQKT